MNLKRNFVINNIQILGGHILIYASGIFLTPVIIKTSGEETYGKYILIITILGLIYGLSTFGVGARTYRLLPSVNSNEKRSELFYPPFFFQLSISILVGFGLIIFFPFVSNWFFDGYVGVEAIYLLVYLVLYIFYSRTVDFFRSTHRMGYFNIATLLQPYTHIFVSLIFYFYTRSLDVEKLFFSQLISFSIIGGYFTILLVREIGVSFSFIPINTLKAEIAFGLPLVFGYIIDQVLAISDRYVIAGVFSTKSVAYYTVAYSLGSLPIFFAKVSGTVLPPILSLQTDSGEKKQGEQMVNYTIKGYLFVTIPFIFGCAILGYPLLDLYANKATAQEAFIVMSIVAFGVVFYGLSIILMNLLFVSMKTKEMFIGNLAAAVVNLSLNLLLIPLLNNIAVAAVTTLLSYIILFTFTFVNIRKDWNIQFDFYFIVKILLGSTIMSLVLLFFLNYEVNKSLSFFELFGLIIVGLLVYGISILLSKAITIGELKSLVYSIKKSN